MIKLKLARIVQAVAPAYYRRRVRKRQLLAMRAYYPEQELHIVPLLCAKDRTSLDMEPSGIPHIRVLSMHRGTVWCSSARVRLPSSKRLQRRCPSLFLYRFQLETVALSDVRGEAVLRVLQMDGGRSTIELDNALENSDGSERYEITVPARRLDDYGLASVGFIKIDVEGHELAVLRGGSATIQRCRPMMLIEIEERHKPNAIYQVNGFLANLGYEGYFVLNGNLLSISSFDLSKHQKVEHISGWRSNWRRSGVYVNNFFFVPSGSKSQLEAAVSEVRSNLSDVLSRDLACDN